jgi:hypothetical protein
MAKKLRYKQNAGLNTKASIVDLLKSKGRDASYAERKKLYSSYAGDKYTGTAEQNEKLIQFVNKGKPPAVIKAASPNQYITGTPARNTLKLGSGEPPGISLPKATTVATKVIQKMPAKKPAAIPATTHTVAPPFKLSSAEPPGVRPPVEPGPQIPESGLVLDKRKGRGYIIKGSKPVYNFPILTGQNVEGNVTYGSNDPDAPIGGKVTPVGYYSLKGKPDDAAEYNNQVTKMTPIPAYGLNKPQVLSGTLGLHATWHPEERNKYYNTDHPWISYGCPNCSPEDWKRVNQAFPQGDTTLVVDSNQPQFSNVMAKLNTKGRGGKMKLCMACGGKVPPMAAHGGILAQNAPGFGNTYNELAPVTVSATIPRLHPLNAGDVVPTREQLQPPGMISPDAMTRTHGDLQLPELQGMGQRPGFNWVDGLHAVEDTIQAFGTESKNILNERRQRIEGLQPVEDEIQDKDRYGLNPASFLLKRGGKNWIKGAVNPAHKGYCTPMTKSTCTPRRKAFARTMKKHHGFHKKKAQYGSDYSQPYVADNSFIEQPLLFDPMNVPTEMPLYATGGLTSDKAKKMLKDGTANGKKLTTKQKKYFGYVAGGGQPMRQNAGYGDDDNIPDVGGDNNPDPEVWAEGGEVARMQNGSIVHIDGSMPGTFDHGEYKGIPGTPVDGAESFLEATSTKKGRSAMADKLLQVPVDTAHTLTGYEPDKALSHATLFLQANEHHNKMRKKMRKRIQLQRERGGDSEGYKNSLKMNMDFANSIPSENDLYNRIFAHQEAVKNAYGIPDAPTEEQEGQYDNPVEEGQDQARYGARMQYAGHKKAVEEFKKVHPPIWNDFGSMYNYYKEHYGYTGKPNDILGLQTFITQNPKTRSTLNSYLRTAPLTNKGIRLYGDVDPKTLSDEKLMEQYRDDLFDFRGPLPMNFDAAPDPAPPEEPVDTPVTPTTTTPDITTQTDTNLQLPPNQRKRSPYFPLEYSDIASSRAAFLASLNRDPETLLHTDMPRVQYKTMDPTRALHEVDIDAGAAAANLPFGTQGAGIKAQLLANKAAAKSKILAQFGTQNVGIVNRQEDVNADYKA